MLFHVDIPAISDDSIRCLLVYHVTEHGFAGKNWPRHCQATGLKSSFAHHPPTKCSRDSQQQRAFLRLATMLMLPSTATGIQSKYSLPFESRYSHPYDFAELKSAMPQTDGQTHQMDAQTQSTESPALLGPPRYDAQRSADACRETWQ
jgi:hypothetical protein